MSKYINADEFLLQYSILTSRPNFTPLSSEMSAWKLWKQEFDRDVVRLISRMATEREDDEQKVIAKIKEIPLAQIPIDDIVRCKDCKHYFIGNCMNTDVPIYADNGAEFMPDSDFYCSYAERKEEE